MHHFELADRARDRQQALLREAAAVRLAQAARRPAPAERGPRRRRPWGAALGAAVLALGALAGKLAPGAAD